MKIRLKKGCNVKVKLIFGSKPDRLEKNVYAFNNFAFFVVDGAFLIKRIDF